MGRKSPRAEGRVSWAGTWGSTELDSLPGFLGHKLLWPPPTSGRNHLWLLTQRPPSGDVRPALHTRCPFPLCSKGAAETTVVVTSNGPAMPGPEPVALILCLHASRGRRCPHAAGEAASHLKPMVSSQPGLPLLPAVPSPKQC